MASKASTPPPQPTVELTVPRGEAESKIQACVERGRELLALPLSDQDQLKAARAEYDSWLSSNQELLKRLFTDDSIAEECIPAYDLNTLKYRKAETIPFDEVRAIFEGDVHRRLHTLNSIKERLGLIPVSYSLTSEARRLIGELKKKKGLSQTAVVEVALRTLAKQEGVE